MFHCGNSAVWTLGKEIKRSVATDMADFYGISVSGILIEFVIVLFVSCVFKGFMCLYVCVFFSVCSA